MAVASHSPLYSTIIITDNTTAVSPTTTTGSQTVITYNSTFKAADLPAMCMHLIAACNGQMILPIRFCVPHECSVQRTSRPKFVRAGVANTRVCSQVTKLVPQEAAFFLVGTEHLGSECFVYCSVSISLSTKRPSCGAKLDQTCLVPRRGPLSRFTSFQPLHLPSFLLRLQQLALSGAL